MTEREQKIKDMRSLLNWLAENPNVPMPDQAFNSEIVFVELEKFKAAAKSFGCPPQVNQQWVVCKKDFGTISLTLYINRDKVPTKVIEQKVEVPNLEALCLTD